MMVELYAYTVYLFKHHFAQHFPPHLDIFAYLLDAPGKISHIHPNIHSFVNISTIPHHWARQGIDWCAGPRPRRADARV